MNTVAEIAFCEAPLLREISTLGGEHIVYTEDVGGSSPSSPTTYPIENIEFGGLFAKFPVGSMNLNDSSIGL